MENKKWMLIVVGLIVLLAGGAYFGARAVAGRSDGGETAVFSSNTNDGLSGVVMDQGEGQFSDDPMMGQVTEMEINSAPELPESAPETSGLVLERKDDTVIIGIGEVNFAVEMNSDGTPKTSISTEGPSVEVVITHDTQIYEDVSDRTAIFSGENISVQQTVKQLDSLDEVALDDATMMVWGTKRGDRIVADVVLVMPPISFSRPAN